MHSLYYSLYMHPLYYSLYTILFTICIHYIVKYTNSRISIQYQGFSLTTQAQTWIPGEDDLMLSDSHI